MPVMRTILASACAVCAAASLAAQTLITAPPNRYSPADDVKIGRDAEREIEKQLPVMHDEQVNGYLTRVGQRLVAAIPPDLQHPEFDYTFAGVNVREINAFALPGGAMFVNRGMLEKAHTEGEVAGVMAHELSHVALRHGTAQQTKGTVPRVGALLGVITGAIVGGGFGQVISEGSQFGAGTLLMRYSRDFEKQADLLGTHLMAAAGYDPREMANVFKTIEEQSGPGGPEFLSDHPNPGNRYDYINAEARVLQVSRAPQDSRPFEDLQRYLRSLPPAPSTEDATRHGAGRNPRPASPDDVRPAGHVAAPASRFRSYDEGGLFRVRVPANWQEQPGDNTVTFVPDGASGTIGGASVFTHGVEIGASRNETHNLRTATDELLRSLAQSNPQLGTARGYDRTALAGRPALHAVVGNVSAATGGDEEVDITTALLDDGTLMYVLGVAPRAEYPAYAGVFRRIVESLTLTGG